VRAAGKGIKYQRRSLPVDISTGVDVYSDSARHAAPRSSLRSPKLSDLGIVQPATALV